MIQLRNKYIHLVTVFPSQVTFFSGKIISFANLKFTLCQEKHL